MTQADSWLLLPWIVSFFWIMLWIPKTKKGWYLAFFVIVCQSAILIYLHYSK
jgi:hypothetical protein